MSTGAFAGFTAAPARSRPGARRGPCWWLSRGAAVFTVSLVILSAGAWRPAWSGDEAATAMVVRRPVESVLRTLRFDPALEPYYLLMKPWAFLSSSELWLRTPSILAMTAAITTVWILAVRLAGDRVGALTVVVMLAIPATSRFAQDARPYAFTMLLTAVAVVVWDDDRLLKSRGRQFLLAALVSLAALSHAYSLLIAPVLVATSWLAPRSSRQREVAVTCVSSLVGILLVAPFLWVVAHWATGQPNPAPVTFANVVDQFLVLAVPIRATPLVVAPFGLVLLGLAIGAVALWWLGRIHAKRAVTLGAVWFVVPPASLCLLQVATGSPGLVARYWLICIPAIALLAALSLNWLLDRSRTLGVVATVVLCATSLPAHVALRAEDGHQGQKWRALTQVASLPALEDSAILTKGYRAVVANDPRLSSRMPLALDPQTSGRVNPETLGSDAASLPTHQIVIAFQEEPGYRESPPTSRSLEEGEESLRHFPRAVALCAFFGEPLGVFTRGPETPTPGQAQRLADEIAQIAPGKVRCEASPVVSSR